MGKISHKPCNGWLWPTVTIVVMVLLYVVGAVSGGEKRDAISFSIIEAPPQPEPKVPQGKVIQRFSVMDMDDEDEPSISAKKDKISFSVYDAKPLESPKGDVPPPPLPGPTEQGLCMRKRNRVLVFHTMRPITQVVPTKVCDGKRCWIENRQVTHSAEASKKFVSDLASVPGWRCSGGEDAHFVLVDVNDPKNAALVKEFKPSLKELPVLARETDGKVRKSAAGMSGSKAADWWNMQFQENPPEAKPSRSGGTEAPHFESDNHLYTYPGTIRQHLTDMHSAHHLPKAVVDSWSDAQCINWHNWHHEVLRGNRKINRPEPNRDVPIPSTQPDKPPQPRASQPRTFPRGSPVSLGYSQGTREYSMAQFALNVAHQTARAPPSPGSFGSDSKKSAKALKKWKSKERERVRKEVRRQVWNQYSTFDPFTIWTILSVLFQVFKLIYDLYGLN